MKKLMFIFLLFCFIGCNEFTGDGIVTDKGIDYIDIRTMIDGFGIKETVKSDPNSISMYWIKLNTCEDKIYINQFSWEDLEIKDFVKVGPEHSDIRFQKEY
jgi:hypothetical protein